MLMFNDKMKLTLDSFYSFIFAEDLSSLQLSLSFLKRHVFVNDRIFLKDLKILKI